MKITIFDITPYNISIAAYLQNFIFKGVHYMNRIKKRSLKMTLLVVLLIGVMITSQMMQAMATSTEPVAIASNFSQLYSAMIQAKDGDVIGINGIISIVGEKTNVGYADKHIIIKRMNSSSRFNVSSETTFQNLTFDGGGIATYNAYATTSGKVTFQDVTFQNSLSESSGGGAIHVMNNTVDFNNCTFDNNTALEGGHIFVNNASTVNIDGSTFRNGHASNSGGAVMNSYYEATTNITNSVITENSAGKHGGGIFNMGRMKITGTKIFDNTAPNGADLANVAYGNLNLADSIEVLVELFKDDGIIPKAWINDYDGRTDLSGEYIDPTAQNSLFKLDYEIPPTEVTLSPSSLGTASDGKIIGLESGKYYKITSDDVVSYSKSDGSFTATELEAEALTGSEIIGLTNGVTYLVEEYIPPVEEEPTDPTDPDPETPDEEDPVEEPTDEEEPKNPVDQEEPKDEEVDADPDHESDPPTSTTNYTTNSNNTSNTTNNTTNNSTTHNSDSRDDSSTVNNNSYDHSTHTTTENTYLPPSNDGGSEKGGQASASQHQTITVDYGRMLTNANVQEDGKNITINVNVNVDTNEKKADEAEPQAVEVLSSNVEADPSSSASNITWTELVKICLLFGIFICVFRRPIAK
ncbi:hypothetical protein [Alkaliphilus sp. B6464]|uniref:hypothetical protein n=1 Tax=Alkaliphilus sp. B6464 TaxID=2731219 RepID=UPI001BA5907F|nr:hypothetical protein [Alkaliphilus sp. B6464]QUH18684.1 hypothetical protein HYG84_01355 [Alkaliphilus sp. B6464]